MEGYLSKKPQFGLRQILRYFMLDFNEDAFKIRKEKEEDVIKPSTQPN